MSPSNRSRYALLVAVAVSAAATVSSFPLQRHSSLQNRIRGNTRIFNQEENSLFEDYQQDDDKSSATTINAQFGESVPLKKPTASFGESVPLKRPTDDSLLLTTEPAVVEQPEELQAMKQRNLVVAIASVLFALSTYVWQFLHPITPVQLLAEMQSNSAPLTSIGSNGKPTVVDFWAPWCENCKMAAPTLQKLEEEYSTKVNFVMINGDRPEAWPLIERFGVDAIPHVALISADGDVETALIGPIPKRVLEADLNVLLNNAAVAEDNDESSTKKQELPYKMLDVFANAPQNRRVQFRTTTSESK